MTALDPYAMEIKDIYRLLISAIVPRPIAFVSTCSKKGEVNLAPFSFFNGVCSNPPCLSISVARKPDGTKKDTLRNIEATGEFVVNSANEWFINQLVDCGAGYPFGVNEMEKVGLTPIASERIKPPRVKEAAAHFECTVYDMLEIGDGSAGSSTLIVGRIQLIHVASSMIEKGALRGAEFKPVGRLGGISYAMPGEIFNLPIPVVDGPAGE